MKFLWGLLVGAFLGAICTMWFINRKLERQQAMQQVAEEISRLPQGFMGFLDRFSSDSLFQIEHITFPLSGLPAYADSATIAEGNFKYYPEDWVMHRSFKDDGTFIREFQVAGDAMVIES